MDIVLSPREPADAEGSRTEHPLDFFSALPLPICIAILHHLDSARSFLRMSSTCTYWRLQCSFIMASDHDLCLALDLPFEFEQSVAHTAMTSRRRSTASDSAPASPSIDRSQSQAHLSDLDKQIESLKKRNELLAISLREVDTKGGVGGGDDDDEEDPESNGWMSISPRLHDPSVITIKKRQSPQRLSPSRKSTKGATADGISAKLPMRGRKWSEDYSFVAGKEDVEALRAEYFGSEVMIQSLNKAVELLSKGLYSADAHFVHEILQNAVDNAYEQTTRELEFELFPPTESLESALVIRNNERGFRCRDLFGICTVGASTKIPQPGGKHFIGRKGIGFKSVFLTTSKPYIFSRELKVYLLDKPTKEIPVAYLVPYWVDGTSQQDKAIMARAYGEESPTQPSRWRDHTVLYLPLNKDHPGVSWLAIESQLLAMQSTIALFINLTTIKFITPTKTFEFVKSTVENETVQIVLLNDKAFAIRSQRISDVPRDKDQPTSDDPEVTVAVPLDPAMMQQTAQSGYLYTYLPTLYVPQLPFLINADFVIPASRERVELTNAWNDRLMIAATTLFVSLYLDLLQDNRIPLATLFCTLPTRTAPEVARYAKMIRKELCGRPTIFCTDAVFRTPMECKIADHHIQTLLHEELEAGDEDLPSIFSGLHFVATKLTEHQVNLDYLTEYFGVTHFTASDWAQLLDSKHSQLSELITSKDDQWICDFLIMLSTLKVPQAKAVELLRCVLPLVGKTPFLAKDEKVDVYLQVDNHIPQTIIIDPLARIVRPPLSELILQNAALTTWLGAHGVQRELSMLTYAKSVLGYCISHRMKPNYSVQWVGFALQAIFVEAPNDSSLVAELRSMTFYATDFKVMPPKSFVSPLEVAKVKVLLDASKPLPDWWKLPHHGYFDTGDQLTPLKPSDTEAFIKWLFSNVFKSQGIPHIPQNPKSDIFWLSKPRECFSKPSEEDIECAKALLGWLSRVDATFFKRPTEEFPDIPWVPSTLGFMYPNLVVSSSLSKHEAYRDTLPFADDEFFGAKLANQFQRFDTMDSIVDYLAHVAYKIKADTKYAGTFTAALFPQFLSSSKANSFMSRLWIPLRGEWIQTTDPRLRAVAEESCPIAHEALVAVGLTNLPKTDVPAEVTSALGRAGVVPQKLTVTDARLLLKYYREHTNVDMGTDGELPNEIKYLYTEIFIKAGDRLLKTVPVDEPWVLTLSGWRAPVQLCFTKDIESEPNGPYKFLQDINIARMTAYSGFKKEFLTQHAGITQVIDHARSIVELKDMFEAQKVNHGDVQIWISTIYENILKQKSAIASWSFTIPWIWTGSTPNTNKFIAYGKRIYLTPKEFTLCEDAEDKVSIAWLLDKHNDALRSLLMTHAGARDIGKLAASPVPVIGEPALVEEGGLPGEYPSFFLECLSKYLSTIMPKQHGSIEAANNTKVLVVKTLMQKYSFSDPELNDAIQPHEMFSWWDMYNLSKLTHPTLFLASSKIVNSPVPLEHHIMRCIGSALTLEKRVVSIGEMLLQRCTTLVNNPDREAIVEGLLHDLSSKEALSVDGVITGVAQSATSASLVPHSATLHQSNHHHSNHPQHLVDPSLSKIVPNQQPPQQQAAVHLLPSANTAAPRSMILTAPPGSVPTPSLPSAESMGQIPINRMFSGSGRANNEGGSGRPPYLQKHNRRHTSLGLVRAGDSQSSLEYSDSSDEETDLIVADTDKGDDDDSPPQPMSRSPVDEPEVGIRQRPQRNSSIKRQGSFMDIHAETGGADVEQQANTDTRGLQQPRDSLHLRSASAPVVKLSRRSPDSNTQDDVVNIPIVFANAPKDQDTEVDNSQSRSGLDPVQDAQNRMVGDTGERIVFQQFMPKLMQERFPACKFVQDSPTRTTVMVQGLPVARIDLYRLTEDICVTYFHAPPPSSTTGAMMEYFEVKSSVDNSPGFQLSRSQWLSAVNHRKDFSVVKVQFALSATPVVVVYNDPLGMIIDGRLLPVDFRPK